MVAILNASGHWHLKLLPRGYAIAESVSRWFTRCRLLRQPIRSHSRSVFELSKTRAGNYFPPCSLACGSVASLASKPMLSATRWLPSHGHTYSPCSVKLRFGVRQYWRHFATESRLSATLCQQNAAECGPFGSFSGNLNICALEQVQVQRLAHDCQSPG